MKTKREISPVPSVEDLKRAHRQFMENESREIFYVLATEKLEMAIAEEGWSIGEALWILLRTWNEAYYRTKPFDGTFNDYIGRFNELIYQHRDIWSSCRGNSILDFQPDPSLKPMFDDFEALLGPVGAAKALHLLAPKFFPLWDREITRTYKIHLGRQGLNVNWEKYCGFMVDAQEQLQQIGDVVQIDCPKHPSGHGSLKLDEWNYRPAADRRAERAQVKIG